MYGEEIYLKCLYEEKEEVKEAGARWDPYKKKWYVPSDLYRDLEKFNKWRPNGRMYLKCDYKDKDQAKSLGARWDQTCKKWYFYPSRSINESDFQQFLPSYASPVRAPRNAAKSSISTPKLTTSPSRALHHYSAGGDTIQPQPRILFSSPAPEGKRKEHGDEITSSLAATKRVKNEPMTWTAIAVPVPVQSNSSSIPTTPESSSTSASLPRITASMTKAQLTHELLHREPSIKGISSKNKQWFLHRLGGGSIWKTEMMKTGSWQCRSCISINENPQFSSKCEVCGAARSATLKDP